LITAYKVLSFVFNYITIYSMLHVYIEQNELIPFSLQNTYKRRAEDFTQGA